MPKSILLLFVFLLLIVLSGLFLFRNYNTLECNQREFIKQERNTVNRMNYLEKIGRNDFNNYTYLLLHKNEPQMFLDSLFFRQFDSLTKVNTGYIADFWLLINSGPETVELDSFKTYRKNYLKAVDNYHHADAATNIQHEKSFTDAFMTYHDFQAQLMNKQYATLSSYLRRSHETTTNEIKTIIAVLLGCMFFAILLSFFVYGQIRKIK